MKRFINRASVVAVMVAMTGLVSSVQAEVVVIESVPTREVFFGDLNLNSQAGIATLHGRIEQAAEEVCGFSSLNRVRLDEAVAQKRCLDKAISVAVSTVNRLQISQGQAKKLTLTAAR